MKTSVLTLFLAISAMATAQVAIKVDIVGLKNNKGQVLIGLYNSENHFLKKSLQRQCRFNQKRKSNGHF